jgi:hypothetical protein
MVRSTLTHSLIALAALALVAAARADLKKDAPKDVCAYLEKEDLKTSEYEEASKGHYVAAAVKRIGGKDSVNLLVYNVDGERPERVTKVWLNLEIDDPAGAKAGHEALVSAGPVLVEKATGKKAPDAVRRALQKGENGKWKVGEWSVEVSRIPKGGGPMYVLQLLIK